MRTAWQFGLVLSLVAGGLSAQAGSPLPVRTRLTPEHLSVELSLVSAGHLLVLDVTSRGELQSLNPDTASVPLAAGAHTIQLGRNGSSNLWLAPIAPPNYPAGSSNGVGYECTATDVNRLGQPAQAWSGVCGLQNRPIVPSELGLRMASTIAGAARRVYLILLEAPLSTDDVLAAFSATRRGATETNWRFRLVDALRKRQPELRLAEVEVPGH